MNGILEKAKKSAFWMWTLNKILQRVIPFNKPHGILITSLSDNAIIAKLPYKRRNLNHLKGMHACALATASEYACGLLLISRMDASKYRLIMKTMHMDYLHQGKTDVEVRFNLEENYIHNLKRRIDETQTVLEKFIVKAYNTKGEHLCTAELEWQLKSWTLLK